VSQAHHFAPVASVPENKAKNNGSMKRIGLYRRRRYSCSLVATDAAALI